MNDRTIGRRSLLGLGLGLGLGSLTLVTACSGSSGGSGKGKVVWSTWGSPEELKGFDAVQEAFKKANPDLELVFNPVPSYADYHSKLLTQLSAGNAPDVFYVGDDRVASVIRNDVLLKLDDQLGDKAAGLALDDFNVSLLEVATFEDGVYALPNDVNPDAFWYDREALKAAGITEDPAELAAADAWTTEVYLGMLDKLKAAGLTGAAFYNYWATHYSWITSQGGKVYDESGAFVADTDQTAVDALQVFGDAFADGRQVVADLLPESAGADSMFVSHKLGFFAVGRYVTSTIEGAGVDKALYDIVRWPTPDGSAKPTGVAASYLAVNKKSKDVESALKFFGMFLNKEGQTSRLKDAGNAVPSIQGADELVTDAGFPQHAQTMIEMRDIGYSNFPTEAAVPDLSNKISVDLMEQVYKGAMSAADALSKAKTMIEESVAK